MTETMSYSIALRTVEEMADDNVLRDDQLLEDPVLHAERGRQLAATSAVEEILRGSPDLDAMDRGADDATWPVEAYAYERGKEIGSSFDAVALVLNLAEGNVIDHRDAGADADLSDARNRQLLAIGTVQDLLARHGDVLRSDVRHGSDHGGPRP